MCSMASLVRNVVFLCVLLAAGVSSVTAALPPGGKLLARSEFHWDNDGWKGYSKRRVVRVDVDMGQVRVRCYSCLAKMELMHALQLRASDDDDSIWFFSAPPSFLGDKSEAFGG